MQAEIEDPDGTEDLLTQKENIDLIKRHLSECPGQGNKARKCVSQIFRDRVITPRVGFDDSRKLETQIFNVLNRKVHINIKTFCLDIQGSNCKSNILSNVAVVKNLNEEFKKSPIYYYTDETDFGFESGRENNVQVVFKEHVGTDDMYWDDNETITEKEISYRDKFPRVKDTYDLIIRFNFEGLKFNKSNFQIQNATNNGNTQNENLFHNTEIVISPNRGIIIETHENNPRDALDSLSRIIRNLMDVLLSVRSNISRKREIITTNDNPTEISGIDSSVKESSPLLPFSLSYNMIFILAIANSGKSKYHWNVKNAIDVYFSPFLKEINHLIKFDAISKVQYHMDLKINPYQGHDLEIGNMHYFLLSENKLFINTNDVISPIFSHDPIINFITYIPSKLYSPLILISKDGNNTFQNTVILGENTIMTIDNNFNQDSPQMYHELSLEYLKPIFSSFISQLKTLIGLPHITSEMLANTFVSFIVYLSDNFYSLLTPHPSFPPYKPNTKITFIPHHTYITRIEMDSLYHFWLYRILKKIFINVRSFEETANLNNIKIDQKYLDNVCTSK